MKPARAAYTTTTKGNDPMIRTRILLAALLGLAMGTASAAELPVGKAGARTGAPVKPERVVRTAPDPEYWLSVAGGLVQVDRNQVLSRGFGGYLGGEQLIAGVRARFTRGFGEVRHSRELGVLVGQRFGNDDNDRWRGWVAVGLGQYEFERRDPDSPEFHDGLNVPLELVASYHWKHVAMEYRAEANLNEERSQVMLGLGLQFGKFR